MRIFGWWWWICCCTGMCPEYGRVILSDESPFVEQFYHFITQDEIDSLTSTYKHRLQHAQSGYSTSVYLNEPADARNQILHRLATIGTACVGRNLTFAEPFSFTFYTEQQHYSWHIDSYDPNQLRHSTLLIYLNTVRSGGETIFAFMNRCQVQRPALAEACANPNWTRIRPHSGRAILFRNVRKGKMDEKSLHASCPVGENEQKWILQLWIRQNPLPSPFYT